MQTNEAEAAMNGASPEPAYCPQAALAEHMKKLPVRPRCTRVLFTNATHAALVDHASQGGLTALILDDAYGVRHAGVVDGRLGAWYGGLPVSEDTRTHGSISVSEPRLVVSIAIQQPELRRYLRANDGAFRSSGMTGRFLVFRAEADYGWRNLTPATSLDHAVVETFHRWFAQRLELYSESTGAGDMVDMYLSPQAAWCLSAWRSECEQASMIGGPFSDVPDAARKSCDHVIRLAACIEDFETGQPIIGMPALQASIEIVRLCLRNFDAVMGCDGSATILYHRAPRLLKWLVSKVPPGHAFAEKLLRAGCHHETCPKEMWEPVLLALEGQGLVLRRKGVLALHPSYFGDGGAASALASRTSAPRIAQPARKGGKA